MHAAVTGKLHDICNVGGSIFFGHIVKDNVAVGIYNC